MSIRIYNLAKELNIESKELVGRLKKMHVEVKGHMSVLDDETAEIVRQELLPQVKKIAVKEKPISGASSSAPHGDCQKRCGKRVTVPNGAASTVPYREQPEEVKAAKPTKVVKISFPISVKDLSVKLQVKPNELIKALMKEKILVHINQVLEEGVVKSISAKFGYHVEELPTDEELVLTEHEMPSDVTKLVLRPPVVTLMGHVDHGKTSLLDAVRKSHVVETEAGAITQHIGAYEVDLDKGKVIFLDTPGHEAFTQMRARGANATDVVVLVVAADDGVMPQTIEAVDHARAAEVPIVVALNKVDLPAANPDKVKMELQKLGLAPEEWGGKTICVEISAKTGQGIDTLLDMLLLEAELLELKADPTRPARGVVIEGRLSRGKGPVATVLIQNGTLKVGETIISGMHFGKIKAMINDKGQMVRAAGPSIPVEVLGLSGVPLAGDSFYVVKDEKQARDISLRKQEQNKQKELVIRQKISLEQLYERIKQGEIKELNLIVKADVQGSVEALIQSLEKIVAETVKLKIVHSGVGRITESDVILASVANAIIIGFHVRPEPKAIDSAELEKVEIRLYDIIYNVIEEMKKAMEGLLEPELNEVVIGRARVRKVFKIGHVGTVAGCMVEKDKIVRAAKIRLVRDDKVIYEGQIKSLKRFKDDAREVSEGYECGIGIENFNDIKENDLFECYRIEKTARKLG